MTLAHGLWYGTHGMLVTNAAGRVLPALSTYDGPAYATVVAIDTTALRALYAAHGRAFTFGGDVLTVDLIHADGSRTPAEPECLQDVATFLAQAAALPPPPPPPKGTPMYDPHTWLETFKLKAAATKAAKQAELRTVQDALLAVGVVAVGCEFSGGGDEGSIDTVSLLTTEHLPDPITDDCDLPDSAQTLVQDGLGTDEVAGGPSEDAVRELCYFGLERFDGDWINNEGGYGFALMDLRTGFLIIDGTQRTECSAFTACQLLDPVAAPPLTLEQVLRQTLGET
jgi:hypothetical protein